LEELSGVDVRIAMQDYQSVHIAVVIWATMVNTQTHRQTDRQTAFDQLTTGAGELKVMNS